MFGLDTLLASFSDGATLGLVSLSFGIWYALGALQVAPYYF
jgi:hypothetical protein